MQAREPKANRPPSADAGRSGGPPKAPLRRLGPVAAFGPGSSAAGRASAPLGPRLAPRSLQGPYRSFSQSGTTQPARLPGPGMPARVGFGLPNLRRNVCPHFYMTGSRGAIPIQAPHLLKALIRQEQNVSRCQLRGGVHLEQGYVNDVCLTPRFNQCVFYEDELTKD